MFLYFFRNAEKSLLFFRKSYVYEHDFINKYLQLWDTLHVRISKINLGQNYKNETWYWLDNFCSLILKEDLKLPKKIMKEMQNNQLNLHYKSQDTSLHFSGLSYISNFHLRASQAGFSMFLPFLLVSLAKSRVLCITRYFLKNNKNSILTK